jgi:hypothetical protein
LSSVRHASGNAATATTRPRRCRRRRARSAAFGVCGLLAIGQPAFADPPVVEMSESVPPRDYDAPDPQRTALTFVRAAANTLLMGWLVWQFDWLTSSDPTYYANGRSIGANIRHGFTFDDDTLAENFVGHPYGGGTGFFAAARATGLNFWESALYPLAGSAFWEYMSEQQYPSTNDLVMTSIGGVALGEILYRISSLALDDSRSGFARFTRELLGTFVAPARGFSRVTTGDAWATGPPPVRKRALLEAHFGADQFGFGTAANARVMPTGLVALDTAYGDLLPRDGTRRIDPYEFFDFYASGILSSEKASGLEFETLGPLYGFSTDLSNDEDRAFRDNHVLEVVQSIEYQGSDAIRFAALGLGIGDTLIFRNGPTRQFRLGVDVSGSPLAGAASPYAVVHSETPVGPPGPGSNRDYNYSAGVSAGALLRWDIGRWGRLGLDGRQYLLTVIEGTRGVDWIARARAWYELDILPDVFGLGVASRFLHRDGDYSGGRRFHGTQLSFQYYLTVRL